MFTLVGTAVRWESSHMTLDASVRKWELMDRCGGWATSTDTWPLMLYEFPKDAWTNIESKYTPLRESIGIQRLQGVLSIVLASLPRHGSGFSCVHRLDCVVSCPH
jgi:hypothetical protein